MSFRAVPTKLFKAYLKSLGLKHVRTKGDHEIWDYPDPTTLLRPVTFIGCEKEIPAILIKTNLSTLGINQADFEKAIAKL